PSAPPSRKKTPQASRALTRSVNGDAPARSARAHRVGTRYGRSTLPRTSAARATARAAPSTPAAAATARPEVVRDADIQPPRGLTLAPHLDVGGVAPPCGRSVEVERVGDVQVYRCTVVQETLADPEPGHDRTRGSPLRQVARGIVRYGTLEVQRRRHPRVQVGPDRPSES